MLTYCNTARGRVACGLGGVLIAVLALACLWAFSPSVTAGDDLLPAVPQRPKEPSKPMVCPDPVPPIMPKGVKSGRDEGLTLPPTPARPPKAKGEASSLPPPLAAESVPPPPLAAESVPPPPPLEEKKIPAVVPAVYSPPPPPAGPIAPVAAVGVSGPDTPPVPQAQPPVDTQDIKQLVAHLNEIRADRAKLDDKERQTILTIKRKYQEQKHALEQMERELRQLGINFDETAPDRPSVGAPAHSR